MIAALPERIAGLPGHLRQICQRIFAVSVAEGRPIPPPTMRGWVEQHFGSLEAVERQTIVKVSNRLTLEGALFNPVRARRPAMTTSADAAIEAWIAEELATDIFRDPELDTPEDLFGRIRGQHSRSASNIAKYEGWHGLVVFDEPHPLRWGRAQLQDYVDVALRWIAAAHARDAQARFPIITWNCLPKSGATLMHGHMQIALARDTAYAQVEQWRRATAQYRGETGRAYLADLADLHEALGLGLPAPEGVRAFAHLTPLRNRELVLVDTLGWQSGVWQQHARERFVDALYDALRLLIDTHGVRSFNAAIALPPLGEADKGWADMAPFARIADRGDPLASRNDWGAMELYATGAITVDPYDVPPRDR